MEREIIETTLSTYKVNYSRLPYKEANPNDVTVMEEKLIRLIKKAAKKNEETAYYEEAMPPFHPSSEEFVQYLHNLRELLRRLNIKNISAKCTITTQGVLTLELKSTDFPAITTIEYVKTRTKLKYNEKKESSTGYKEVHPYYKNLPPVSLYHCTYDHMLHMDNGCRYDTNQVYD